MTINTLVFGVSIAVGYDASYMCYSSPIPVVKRSQGFSRLKP
jgi:hypothetical protein